MINCELGCAPFKKTITLKKWCEKHHLYYFGVVRFLKGHDCNVNFYSLILEAVNKERFERVTHYLATDLRYSDLADIEDFIKQLKENLA
jgi:hypothetical protein